MRSAKNKKYAVIWEGLPFRGECSQREEAFGEAAENSPGLCTSFRGSCTVMDDREASGLFPLEAALLVWCRVLRLLLFNKEPCMCPGEMDEQIFPIKEPCGIPDVNGQEGLAEAEAGRLR